MPAGCDDGAVVVIEDVTERRRLEEIRRDFVANITHELKTPVGGLGVLAETLEDESDPEVVRRLAARIHHEAFRVSELIDDLLELSRIEAEERLARGAGPAKLDRERGGRTGAADGRAGRHRRQDRRGRRRTPPWPVIAASSCRPSPTWSTTR